MLFQKTLASFALINNFISLTTSHAVLEDSVPLVKKSDNAAFAKRQLAKCEDSEYKAALLARRKVKRQAFVNEFRSFNKRTDIESVNKTYDGEVQCVLAPEVTIGPYYVEGELVRDDITEGEDGIEMFIDLQLLNINTCEPISGLNLDVWHCNATGIYSGVSAEDTKGLTFLRGIGESDEDGLVFMKTIFPGWYESRTVHIHIASHINATVESDGTLSGGTVNHIGQLFFEEDLTELVAAVYPYSTSTVDRTTNSEDTVYSEESENGYNAIMTVDYLGDTLADGLIAYISIGINVDADYDSDVKTAD